MISAADLARTMDPVLRERFERDGYAVIPDALTPVELASLRDAVDELFAKYERDPGRPSRDLHLLGAVGRDPAFVRLVDHPATLPAVRELLGWNIHVYHSHVDVNLPEQHAAGWTAERHREAVVDQLHQDIGQLDVDLGLAPPPRMSVKVGFWLTDGSAPGSGNLYVVPASHQLVPGPPVAEPVPVLARAGSAVLFDRRTWHARGVNAGATTRKVVYLAYTYRWIRSYDDLVIDSSCEGELDPIRRQLLDVGHDPRSCFRPDGTELPLRDLLVAAGVIEPSLPPGSIQAARALR